jgi:putative transposase
VHLLLSEPVRGNPSRVMQAIKQGFARRLLGRLRKAQHRQQLALWSSGWNVAASGSLDFVVFSEKKRVEKQRYMYRNPVKRGLVLQPELWAWSSYRGYAYGEAPCW